MNILDFASNTEEEEVLKNNPQSYKVIGEVVNSAVQGDGPAMNYQPNANQGMILQDVIGAEQSQLANEEQQVAQQASEVAQQEQVVQNQEQAVQQEAQGETSFLKGLADGFASVFTNPDVLTGLNSFSAAMRGDINSYNQYQNAYAERLEQRGQQRAAAQQKQRDNEAANARARRDQLWQMYTPESVAEFERTGVWEALVENQATKMAREAHDTDVAYKSWQMNNEEKKFEHQVSTDNRDYQFKSSQADLDREESTQERLDKGEQNAVENAQRDRSIDVQQQNADLSKQEKQATRDSASKEKWEENEQAALTNQKSISAVDNLLADDGAGIDNNFGLISGRTPMITTEAQKTDAQLQNLSAILFVNGVQDLRGLGALSNAEGAKISAAAAVLYNPDGTINYKISPAQAKQALKDLREGLQSARERNIAKRDSYKAPDYATDSRYQSGGGNAGSTSTQAPTSRYQDGQRVRYQGKEYIIQNGKPVPVQ